VEGRRDVERREERGSVAGRIGGGRRDKGNNVMGRRKCGRKEEADWEEQRGGVANEEGRIRVEGEKGRRR